MSTFVDLLHGGPRWALLTNARLKGGGSTESTSYTSSLPEYAEPYYTALMEDAQNVAGESYIPYGSDRISDFGGSQTDAMNATDDLFYHGNPALDYGINTAAQGADLAYGATQQPGVYSTYQQGDPYNSLNFSQQDLENLAMDPSGQYVTADQTSVGQFGAGVRDQYMSPYQEAVTERLKEQAILDSQRAKLTRDDAAIKAGAFGGDRRFVGDYLAEEGLMRNLGDIEAEGLQNAYLNAQEQFERDRAAQYASDRGNQGANLEAGQANLNALIQSSGMNQDAVLQALGLQDQSGQFGAGLAQQGAEFGSNMEMDAQQFNKGYGLDAIDAMYGGSDLLGNLGDTAQQAELDRINQMYDMGSIEQSREQQVLDTAYEDFINQRDYDRNTLTWLGGILHGVPVETNSDTVGYTPAPNPYSQALGAGIAGAGLYNSFI